LDKLKSLFILPSYLRTIGFYYLHLALFFFQLSLLSDLTYIQPFENHWIRSLVYCITSKMQI